MTQETTGDVARIIQDIEKVLADAEPATIEALRPFVQEKPKQDQIFSCFELFHTQDYGLNYNRFFVKEKGGKKILDTEWGSAISDESFIPQLAAYMEKTFSQTELSEKDGILFAEKHEQQLFSWFARCWKSAGGEHSIIPTYFAFDKEYRCRDLSTGKIFSEKEAALQLGYTTDSADLP